MTGKCSFLNYLQTLAQRIPREIGPDNTVEIKIESKGEARAAQAICTPGSDMHQRFGFWSHSKKPVSMIVTKEEAVKFLGASLQLLKRYDRVAIRTSKEGKFEIGFKKMGVK